MSDFVTPWAAAHQDPLSMEFSKQEYLVGCHFLLQIQYRYLYVNTKKSELKGTSRIVVTRSWGLGHLGPKGTSMQLEDK